MKTMKVVMLASAMALPSFFSGSAFAISGCGACRVGAQPAPHTFVTPASTSKSRKIICA